MHPRGEIPSSPATWRTQLRGSFKNVAAGLLLLGAAAAGLWLHESQAVRDARDLDLRLSHVVSRSNDGIVVVAKALLKGRELTRGPADNVLQDACVTDL